MKASHKHQMEIIAWANGEDIQCLEQPQNGIEFWTDVPDPMWCKHVEYRVKPKPIMARMFVTKNINESTSSVFVHQSNWTIQPELVENFGRWLTDWVEVQMDEHIEPITAKEESDPFAELRAAQVAGKRIAWKTVIDDWEILQKPMWTTSADRYKIVEDDEEATKYFYFTDSVPHEVKVTKCALTGKITAEVVK